MSKMSRTLASQVQSNTELIKNDLEDRMRVMKLHVNVDLDVFKKDVTEKVD